jgi:hypothetical protein
MRDPAHENLIELLRRFMDEPAARAAQEDIQAGERFLEAHPVSPDARLVAAIKTQMAVAALHRRRIVRLVHGSLAAAAAVIVLALIGLLGPGSANRPTMSSYAALIPPAIWDSDDITTTDLDLAYFSSEIRQIEAQVQALEAGDNGTADNDASDEIELELLALQAEFWKG